MKCLASTESSVWLQERSIQEAPYERTRSAAIDYIQFVPPEKGSVLLAFTRHFIACFGDFPGALLTFTDWPLYHSDEMALLDSLRRGHGELRSLIEAPSHVFESGEQSEAIGHSSLALLFGWTAYLYLASGDATALFWEGDIVDFWSRDKTLTDATYDVIRRFELRIVSE